jgi:glycosyltransferase involved in cell wall biosynthesis
MTSAATQGGHRVDRASVTANPRIRCQCHYHGQVQPPRIVALAGGEPFARATWSGASYWLLSALREAGVLAGAVAARPKAADLIERASSFAWDRDRWRQRYWAQATPLAQPVRSLVAAVGTRRAAEVDPAPDAVLQLGAWFDATNAVEPRLRCSYHDMHLALYLTRPDNKLDKSSRLVRKALERERRTLDRMDLILSMSDWLRQSIIDDTGQDPAKVVTVWTGANFDIPAAPPERDIERPRFLFVGMRFERKGGPYLLQAFEQVRRERPDAELWIVGPEKRLEQRDGVRWFGRIDRSKPAGDAELKRIYSEATVFVMPSIFEPTGNVFLEAMAHGLPCVGVNSCAMPEFIEDGRSGLLARRADVDSLASKMLELAAAPERAQRMGESGFQRVTERFNWSRVAGSMRSEIEARLGRVR